MGCPTDLIFAMPNLNYSTWVRHNLSYRGQRGRITLRINQLVTQTSVSTVNYTHMMLFSFFYSKIMLQKNLTIFKPKIEDCNHLLNFKLFLLHTLTSVRGLQKFPYVVFLIHCFTGCVIKSLSSCTGIHREKVTTLWYNQPKDIIRVIITYIEYHK